MFALREQYFGQLKMSSGRGDNVQRVAGGGSLGNGMENVRVMFGGDFLGGVRLGVEDAGEFHLAGSGEFRVNADMILTQRARAEDGDFDLRCHAGSLKFSVQGSKFKVH
jgi:hypothetical protein